MRVVIYGSRPDGHAKVVIATLEAVGGFDIAGLIDDVPANRERRVRGHAVLGPSEALAELVVDGAILGFGDAADRQEALNRVRNAGLAAPTVVHPRALVFDGAALGQGV